MALITSDCVPVGGDAGAAAVGLGPAVVQVSHGLQLQFIWRIPTAAVG